MGIAKFLQSGGRPASLIRMIQASPHQPQKGPFSAPAGFAQFPFGAERRARRQFQERRESSVFRRPGTEPVSGRSRLGKEA